MFWNKKDAVSPVGLPPNFGNWCPGIFDDDPINVSFRRNPRYAASAVAVNSARWAMNGTTGVNATMASLGVWA